MNRPESRARTLRLTLEYDGAEFHGWARQPDLRTVQGVLEKAAATLWPGAGPVAVAGRTDAGVHATGQVASLVVEGGPPAERVPLALGQLLPADIAVRACVEAPAGFNARFDARSRTYAYRVLRARTRSPLRARQAFHTPHPLDLGALDACAALLIGVHDFEAFTPTETEHDTFERTVIAAGWAHHDDESCFTVEADSFLRHMVRGLIGTMLLVARGGMDVADFAALLRGAPRAHAGATAPAHALCLTYVRYQDDP